MRNDIITSEMREIICCDADISGFDAKQSGFYPLGFANIVRAREIVEERRATELRVLTKEISELLAEIAKLRKLYFL